MHTPSGRRCVHWFSTYSRARTALVQYVFTRTHTHSAGSIRIHAHAHAQRWFNTYSRACAHTRIRTHERVPAARTHTHQGERLHRSVTSDSLQPHGRRSLAGWPWDAPGRNTGVGRHALLQGVFPTQGPSLHRPHGEAGALPSEPPGKPRCRSACI